MNETVVAIKTGETKEGKKYDYTALWAVLAWISPEAIAGLIELLNYVVHADAQLGIPDEWKPRIRFAAFLLALWARSVAVRKPVQA